MRCFLVLLFAVVVAGCATPTESEPAAASDDSAEVDESTADTDVSEESAGDDESADVAEAPEDVEEQVSDPVETGPVIIAATAFGEAHTRDPGLLGEGWTLSIDEVISAPPVIDGEDDCLAVTGTATLDSLEEGLTSSGFSFPTVKLVQNGVVNMRVGFCDTSGLEASGLISSVGAEVTEGTTFQWFQTFAVTEEAYDFVAIEETVYETTGAEVQIGVKNEPVSVGGSDDGPYVFGDAHSRESGLLGEGWTVSVDEVTAAPPLTDDGLPCLVVIGTATLDSLEEGLTSSGFSFPTINLIQSGVVNTSIGFCDTAALDGQGFVSAVGAQVTEGTTFRWFTTYESADEEFDVVAVEETTYEQS